MAGLSTTHSSCCCLFAAVTLIAQGLGPDGGFVVQCTGASRSAATATARAQAVTAAEPPADPALVFGPTDGYPVTAATGADALVPMAANAPVNP
jgi:hypothetical protein